MIFQEKLTIENSLNFYYYNKIYYNIYIIMSKWLDYVKAYAEKNIITYKQALKDALPSYKKRNEKKPEELKQEQPTKLKRKSNKKVVENITLKL
jgi:hypothetical protein